jgi:signal peptidase II
MSPISRLGDRAAGLRRVEKLVDSGSVLAVMGKLRTWSCLLALLILTLDQGAKIMVLHLLRVEGATLQLPGPVALTLVLNRSNAFGMVPISGELSRWGLAGFNLAVAAGLMLVLFRRPTRALTAAGIAALAAGAVGNALDRCWLGAVVDFVDVSKLGFHWIFNIADASVDLGIGLLLLGSFILGPAAGPAKPQGAASRPS